MKSLNWLISRHINLLLFFLLLIIIPLLQYSLLQPVLKQGLTADDWKVLFEYKTYGPAPLFNFLNVWRLMGPYTTSHFYYVGILESLFGLNYEAFQTVNIIIKTVATLIVFPFILIVFKDRLLATFTTILFAVSHSSTGSLQYLLYGTEYLAIFFMLIFFICYYYTFKQRKPYHLLNKYSLIVPPLLLLITFFISPIRIYPLFIALLLIETFLFFQTKSINNSKSMIIMLSALFLPIFLLSSLVSGVSSGYINGPLMLFNQIIKGSWELVFTPFSGLGYLFLTTDFFAQFNSLGLSSFILFYAVLTILISFLLSKRPLRFFLSVFITTLLLSLLYYHKESSQISFYPISFGIYIFVIAIFTFLEWLTKKKEILLIILSASIILSAIFLWSTWLILGNALIFEEATHRYLVMPTLGVSIFEASLLTIFYNWCRRIKLNRFGQVAIVIILVLIYKFSDQEIKRHFNNLLSMGTGAQQQVMMEDKLLSIIKNNYNSQTSEPILLFIDSSEDTINTKFYEVTLKLSYFGYWVHVRRGSDINGCIGMIYNKEKLKDLIVVKDRKEGFIYDGFCVENKYGVGQKKVFYELDNFYALKLSNKEFNNIKEELLTRFGF